SYWAAKVTRGCEERTCFVMPSQAQKSPTKRKRFSSLFFAQGWATTKTASD
ncbi:MAG: hypothetical protein ACI8VL_000399, partial [Bacteroidia bacterium]